MTALPYAYARPLNLSRTPPWKSPALAGRSITLTALSLLERIVEHYRVRRAIAELATLDDRTLKDIGVPRCEIPYRVHRSRGN